MRVIARGPKKQERCTDSTENELLSKLDKLNECLVNIEKIPFKERTHKVTVIGSDLVTTCSIISNFDGLTRSLNTVYPTQAFISNGSKFNRNNIILLFISTSKYYITNMLPVIDIYGKHVVDSFIEKIGKVTDSLLALLE